MAAVIQLRTSRQFTDERPLGPAARRAPELRVIEGGRSSAGRRMRRIFLVRRAVVGAGLVLVLWLVAQVVGAALTPLGAAPGPVAVSGAVHVVQPGETLWGLAAAVDPNADPRDVVDRIIELNQDGPAVSPGGQLRSGAELRLPVAS